jgi:hypothetical protein
MAADEDHARRIVQIMKDEGTAAGENISWGAIEAVWLTPDNADRKELLAGMQYAGDHGWVENAGGTMVRLTAKGANI